MGQKYDRDIVEKVVNTISSYLETFSKDDVEKLAESHKICDESNIHTPDKLYYAYSCVDLGICE